MVKAGLEIRADMKLLRKEMADAAAEFRTFNKAALNAATGVKPLEDQAKKAGGALGFLKSTFGQTMGAIVGANVLSRVSGWFTGWAKSIVQSSSALTELDSKARVVFGESFPSVRQQVNAIADEVGRSSSAVLQFATDMGAVIKAFGLAGPTMENMSTQLAKLAVDMASFHNASDGDAFMALRSGLTGETEPLKRFGIVLTDTNLKIFANEKGIRKSVEQMNQAEKTVLRYSFIMDKTADAQGDAARTADSFANQTRRLQGEWASLNEELGKEVTPILAKGLGVLNDFLTGILLPAIQIVKREFASFLELVGLDAGAGSAVQGIKDRWNIVTGKAYEIKSSQVDLTREKVNAAVALGLKRAPTDAEFKDWQLKEQMKEAAAAGNGLGSGSGGAKKAAEELEKAEREVLSALGEQAKANLDNLNIKRKELQIRKDLGIATKQELRELDRINGRVQYQEELLDDAVAAWEKQKGVVENLQKEIDDLTKSIKDFENGVGDAFDELQKQLDKIDDARAKRKKETVADLLQEQEDLNAKLGRREGLSKQEQDRLSQIESLLSSGAGDPVSQQQLLSQKKQLESYAAGKGYSAKDFQDVEALLIEQSAGGTVARMNEIAGLLNNKYADLRNIVEQIQALDSQIGGTGNASENLTAIKEGTDLFNTKKNENPFDAIDRESEEQKAQARLDAEDKLNDSRRKLVDKTKELNQAEKDLKSSSDEVAKSLDALTISTDANFTAIEARTKTHVDNQIEQLSKLRAAYAGVYGGGSDQANAEIRNIAGANFASGGPVIGPGGPRDDRVAAWLSNGEYVINAAATKAYRPILDRINSMSFQIPRFASGGPVSSSDSHDQHISVTQHLHGDAARSAPDPRHIRWTLRKHS